MEHGSRILNANIARRIVALCFLFHLNAPLSLLFSPTHYEVLGRPKSLYRISRAAGSGTALQPNAGFKNAFFRAFTYLLSIFIGIYGAHFPLSLSLSPRSALVASINTLIATVVTGGLHGGDVLIENNCTKATNTMCSFLKR